MVLPTGKTMPGSGVDHKGWHKSRTGQIGQGQEGSAVPYPASEDSFWLLWLSGR